MYRPKYVRPKLVVFTFILENSLSVSSASFTTGGAGAIPQIEEWEDDLKQVDWEFLPPET
ncbi:hypothetical protein [Sphingobacterium rhinopitheci]|uniref:hypothetical protein n=1 Tax=Sphingobacterium rhinopitheci TaxID=2781960 RepID=UPI001F521CB2|nr:hypothetical protein [Sphingobacterium rhinopitheci]MCI0921726.1 hypothetical protein [Sphingobacterium rhinopitheci]